MSSLSQNLRLIAPVLTLEGSAWIATPLFPSVLLMSLIIHALLPSSKLPFARRFFGLIVSLHTTSFDSSEITAVPGKYRGHKSDHHSTDVKVTGRSNFVIQNGHYIE